MTSRTQIQIVTANDLFDGDVVFLASDGGWSRLLSDAAVAETADEAAVLLAEAEPQEDVVVGPYLAEVERDGQGHLTPIHYRERIRLLGPSNRTDLGRQADAA